MARRDLLRRHRSRRAVRADPRRPALAANPDGLNAPENHYPTLPLAEIKELQPPAAANAVLFLWAVNCGVPDDVAAEQLATLLPLQCRSCASQKAGREQNDSKRHERRAKPPVAHDNSYRRVLWVTFLVAGHDENACKAALAAAVRSAQRLPR